MYQLLVALVSLTTISALQLPLINQAPLSTGPKTLVSSDALESRITKENLLKRAKDLYKVAELSIEEFKNPTRVIGSKGHEGTLEYITSSIADLGDYYTLSNQTFHATLGRVYYSNLKINDSYPVWATTMALTPPTPGGKGIQGYLIEVDQDGCDEDDYPYWTKGNVVLIRRGTCSFGEKSALAGKAGAIAALIYMTDDEKYVSGTLGTPNKRHVPTWAIGRDDADKYLDQIRDTDKVEDLPFVEATINGFVYDTPTTNIIAQTTGGDQDNCIMLGAHSDSVPAGPGINDDGSGSLTLLEVATQLVNYEVKNCVTFAWWSAEEEGLIGSRYFVSQLSEEENMKIRLFMDYDMLASPNYAYQVYYGHDGVNPQGSAALRDMYTNWYDKNGLNWIYTAFDGRSDYDAFIKNGIPGGGIATGAEGIMSTGEAELFNGTAGKPYDICYHLLCDDVSNLALDAWEINSKLVAHSVATYALSLDDFPKRTNEKFFSAFNDSPYLGPNLFT